MKIIADAILIAMLILGAILLVPVVAFVVIMAKLIDWRFAVIENEEYMRQAS